MIYELAPMDSRKSHWLFFHDDSNGRLVVRPEYRALACPGCGKISEERALREGVSSEFRVNSNKDWLGTSEGWIVVSERFCDLVHAHDIKGAAFYPIPSEPGHFVFQCVDLVETDEEKAGFESKNKCSMCDRHAEKLVGPLQDGMKVPPSQRTFFASEIMNENVKAGYRPVFAHDSLCKILKKGGIKGIDYVEAL